MPEASMEPTASLSRSKTMGHQGQNQKAQLLELSKGHRHKMVASVREMVKRRSVDDPDLWPCVKSAMEAVVEQFVIDLEVEMESALQEGGGIPRTESDILGPYKEGFLQGVWLWLRATVLSHYVPCDRSVYGKFKDPVFLLMYVSTLLPIHGLRVGFFSLVLLMLLNPGPHDEYQLIQFICMFKGTQFLASGVIYMARGSMAYFTCFTFEKDYLLTCIDKTGPGAAANTGQAVDYLGSLLLVWIAFSYLPSAKKHTQPAKWGGRAPLMAPVHGNSANTRERSMARLRTILLYDFCCFVLSLVCLAALTCGNCQDTFVDGWPTADTVEARNFRGNLFWSFVLYSLLSLPFSLFTVPGLHRVLTHNEATGYNRHGACVAFVLRTKDQAGASERGRGLRGFLRSMRAAKRSGSKTLSDRMHKTQSKSGGRHSTAVAGLGHGQFLAESVRLVPGAIQEIEGVAHFRVEAVPDLTMQGALGEARQVTHRYEDFVTLIARLNQCAVRGGAPAAPPLPPPAQGRGGLEVLRRDLDTWLKDVVLDPRSRSIWFSDLREFLDFHELGQYNPPASPLMGRKNSLGSDCSESEAVERSDKRRKSFLNALKKHEQRAHGTMTSMFADTFDSHHSEHRNLASDLKDKMADAMRSMHFSPTHSPGREKMWRSSSFTPSVNSGKEGKESSSANLADLVGGFAASSSSAGFAVPACLEGGGASSSATPHRGAASTTSRTPRTDGEGKDVSPPPPRESPPGRGRRPFASSMVSKLEHLKEKALHPRQHS